MKEKIKALIELCNNYHLDLMIKHYDTREVCFKGVNDNEDEIFNVCIWYPPKHERTFYIEINSKDEEWTGGHFKKEDILLLLSIDELSDEELNIKKGDV